MKRIEVICPLYNAEELIIELHNRIKAQKNVEIVKVKYILTESSDKTEEVMIQNNIPFIKYDFKFSHYKTRQKALMDVNENYAIMITQDVILEDVFCFDKLVNYLSDNNLAICYARQIAKKGLDRYYREISYSKESYVYDKNDLDIKGLDACFCSDACSCYDVNLFKKINGYDDFDFPTNEDMYYAHKCLTMNYRVGYCAEAYVHHTHKYTIKQTYNRYITIGKFFKLNPDIKSLKSSKKKYIKVVFKALKRFDIIDLCKLPFDVLARIFGMKKGKK